jgi:hypothetical protein
MIAKAAELDITGIRLGMSSAEAKQTAGTSFNFEDLKWTDPEMMMYKGVSSDQKEGYLLLTLSDKVYYVGHYSIYTDQQSSPNAGQLEADVVAKYGPPSHKETLGGARLFWFLDSQGNVINSGSQLYKGAGYNCYLVPGFSAIEPVGSGALPYPINFPAACHQQVQVNITTSANRSLVSGFDAVLWDDSAMYVYLKGKADAAAKAASDAAEAAKKNRPRL